MKKGIKVIIFVLIIILLFIIIKIPYRFFYNYGNEFYKTGRYETAIDMYEISLKLLPPDTDRCDIRVNIALSILKKIDNYTDVHEHKEDIFKILDEAEKVLCEEGCAHKNDSNGHDREAQKLEDDINKFRKELENESKDEKKDDKDNKKDDSKDNNNDDKNETEKKKEKIEEMRKNAEQARAEDEARNSYYTSYDFKNYNSKKW